MKSAICASCTKVFKKVRNCKTCSDVCGKAHEQQQTQKKNLRKRERYVRDADYRERMKKQRREWARERYSTDPEYRERDNERHRERRVTDPEYRERVNERNRERWATDFEYQDRQNERRRELRADPEYREWQNEQQRERQRELRAAPEYRERDNEQHRDWRLKGRVLLQILRTQCGLQQPLSPKERRELPGLYKKLMAGQSVTSEQTTRMAREKSRRREALLDQTNEPTPEDEKTDA